MEVLKKILGKIGKFLKKIRIPLILLVIAFIVITFIRFTGNSAKKMMEESADAKEETAVVEKRDLVETVTATGMVESAKKRTIASTIVKDTKITSVRCKEGDEVQEGDILVTFSYESIDKQISQLKEDIAESKATKAVDDTQNTRTYYYSYGTESINIRDLQIAIEQKKKDLDEACNEYGDSKRKLEDLKRQRDEQQGLNDYYAQMGVSGNSANTQNYDQLISNQENAVATALKNQENAQRDYDKAVRDLEDEIYKGSNTLAKSTEDYQKNTITSNDNTKKLQRQLEEQTDKLDDYVMTAPISGTVTKVNVEENNSYAGGDLVTIQDCSTLYVSTEIDEYDIPNIQIGQKVVFKTDATRDDELEGVIDEIATTSTAAASSGTSTQQTAAASTAASGSATYAVKVKVLTEDPRLKLGMTAKLSIVINEVQDVLTVPYDAITDQGDGTFIVRTIDDETAKKLAQLKDKESKLENAFPDIQKSENSEPGMPPIIPGGEPSVEKKEGPPGRPPIAEELEDENEGKGFFGKIANIFKVAYGKPDDSNKLLTPENQIDVPVQIGIESDYYTQISGAGVKEGMTVVIQSTEEADNPFEMMMGF